MRIEWLYKDTSDQVIVFFNGWGMDAHAVEHLSADCDLVLLNDYRELKCDCPKELSGYRKIYLIAWSMGVWAAANVIPEWKTEIEACVAINGTERPIDDTYGIPLKIYELTEKGMDEKGREKFFSRMLDHNQRERFVSNRPVRELGEQCEELVMIRKQSAGMQNTLKWNQVYIADRDLIFTTCNQQNWWSGRAPVSRLTCGHYPFYEFRKWEEILFQQP